MYTYNVEFYSTKGDWYSDGYSYTNVTLYLEGAQIGKWTYRNDPKWLKRRVRKLEKKYGATYAK